MRSLLDTLADWRPIRVAVVGDFMLDQLVYGDAERLTADAPVPVLLARRTVETAGGAANVCVDLVAMEAEVRAFGVVGDDREADLLAARLAEQGVATGGLLRDPSRPTTVKRNLIGLAQHRHPQKMFRVDFESREPIAEAIRAALVDALVRVLPETDVVAIEDYGKGVCSEELCQAVIEAGRVAGVPVLVDPASRDDYARYRGCTAITPNRTEAERATGMRLDDDRVPEASEGLARTLADQLGCEAIVLTLDRHGALLLERGTALHVPTVARQVYDVTGAGDMVLAALVAGRGNGLRWADAVQFANAAAGLEVEVFGVEPIPLERIHRAILLQHGRITGKLRSAAEALVEVRAARRDGRRVVFTNGCFDLLHAGHVALLRSARACGDLLVVAINSDDSVRRLKGPERPVHGQEDRAVILGELESVDIVVVFDEDTPCELLRLLEPDVLVKGADYTREQVVGRDIVEGYGGRVELVELLEGRSTSGAIARMQEPSA